MADTSNESSDAKRHTRDLYKRYLVWKSPKQGLWYGRRFTVSPSWPSPTGEENER